MLFFSFIFYTISDSENLYFRKLIGNWNDSSPYDETIQFFEFLYPSKLSDVKTILNSFKNKNKDNILNALIGTLDHSTLGLLNLSLNMRYFQPIASILNPISTHKPILSGWSVLVKKNIRKFNYNNLQFKLLTYLFNQTNNNDKIDKLKRFIQKPGYLNELENINIDEELMNGFLAKDYDHFDEISAINGRIVGNNEHEILDALISEFQNIEMFKFLGLNKNEYIDLLYENPQRKVYEFIPPIQNDYHLQNHLLDEIKEKWTNVINVNATNPFDLLRTKIDVVKIQVFLELSSPQTLPTLELMLELTENECPYKFEVFLIGDLNNQTEKNILYSFKNTILTINLRDACDYLRNGILNGWKKAYRKTRPEVSWSKLPSLMKNGTLVHDLILNELEYAKKYGINNFTIIVNGQAIKEYPSFTEIKNAIFEQALRLKDYAKRKLINNSTNILDFCEEHGIPMESLKSPLKIGYHNQISIDSLRINQIIEILNLTKHNIVYKSNLSINPIPVFYVDSEPPNEYLKSPNFEVRKIKSFSLRNAKTIVGPLLFDFPLSNKELQYALYYVKLGFFENLRSNLSSIQLFYILLWRSTLGLNGIKRTHVPQLNTSEVIIFEFNSTLNWYVFKDPFSEGFNSVIQMISDVINYKISNIKFIPKVSCNEFTLPKHLNYFYFPIMNIGRIKYASQQELENSIINIPSNWEYKVKGNDILITGIATYCFAYSSKIVQIDNQRRIPDENGLFIPILPIGSYKTIGIKEKEFKNSFFIPKVQILTPNYERIEYKKDTKLNIFTFSTDPQSENQTRMMLFTLLNNSNNNVRIWMFNEFRRATPSNLEIINIPHLWIPNIAKPINRICYFRASKFALLDLIFPPEIQNVLFVDQGIIFRGNVSAFMNLDVKGCAVAAPLISSSTKESYYWNSYDNLKVRFKRPYHRTTLLWFDMNKWREYKGGNIYRDMFDKAIKNNQRMKAIDDELFNRLQLYVQTMTLPETTVYCLSSSNPDNLYQSFSIALCNSNSKNDIHDFNEIHEKAYKEI